MNKYTLDSHISTHHSEFAKACNLCDKVYGLTELLDKHIRLKHDTTERVQLNPTKEEEDCMKLGWKCTKCDRVFKSKKTLNTHYSAHLEDKMMECDICNKKLRNLATLEKHKVNLHMELFVFFMCGERCISKISLKQHLTVHGAVCKTCSQVFKTILELEKHAKTHNKNTKCDLCLKYFSNLATLKKHHERIHLKETKFSCSGCEKEFSSKIDLKVHSTEHGDRIKPVFVCDKCGKCYSSTAKLKTHVLYYHQQAEKPYQCKVCQKKFVLKPELLRHMERHTDEPMHPCNECDKKFFTKSDMLRHVKVLYDKFHAGSCHLCGRKFLTVGGREWIQHMNAHNGIK